MPSQQHQRLLLWGARSLEADGFEVAGIDGSVEQAGSWFGLMRPFDLNGVRADAYGVRPSGDLLGFVEAKIEADIDNDHTRRQLRVFGFVRMREGKDFCPLYIAIPRSAAYRLDQVLIDLGLIGAQNVKRIHVPDQFLRA